MLCRTYICDGYSVSTFCCVDCFFCCCCCCCLPCVSTATTRSPCWHQATRLKLPAPSCQVPHRPHPLWPRPWPLCGAGTRHTPINRSWTFSPALAPRYVTLILMYLCDIHTCTRATMRVLVLPGWLAIPGRSLIPLTPLTQRDDPSAHTVSSCACLVLHCLRVGGYSRSC
jgi:hypothetical protein